MAQKTGHIHTCNCFFIVLSDDKRYHFPQLSLPSVSVTRLHSTMDVSQWWVGKPRLQRVELHDLGMQWNLHLPQFRPKHARLHTGLNLDSQLRPKD